MLKYSWLRFPNPPISWKPTTLPPHTPAVFILFIWLNLLWCHICFILLNDMTDLYLFSLGTFVSEAPCYVFYVTRNQVCWCNFIKNRFRHRVFLQNTFGGCFRILSAFSRKHFTLTIIFVRNINPIQANFPFYISWKRKTLWLSDVFRRYEKKNIDLERIKTSLNITGNQQT